MSTIVSSYIPTSGSVDARTVDLLSFPFLSRPQAMTVYVRFQERGTAAASGVSKRILQVGSDTDPRFIVGQFTGGTVYGAASRNATGSQVTSTLTTGPAVGQIVELLVTLSAAGAVQISQSINGAAVTTATATASQRLPAAWSAQTLYVNTGSAGGNAGAIALMNLLVVRGVQDMPTMRRLAGTVSR